MKISITITIIFSVLLLNQINFAQDISSGCERTAYVGTCKNLALPENYEQAMDKFNRCLEEQLSLALLDEVLITPDTDEETLADWNEALENCKHLKINYNRKFEPISGETMALSLQTAIASVLTCDRFHMVNLAIVQAYRKNSELMGIPVKADKSTIPEYFFEATYDCAKDPVIRTYENQYGEMIDEELWPSYLNIRMYFDGEQKELVKEWTVNANLYSWSPLMRKMFINNSSSPGNEPALMRKEIPVTDLLDNFEKKPITCQLKPEKYNVEPGEEIEITISDFRDANNRSSREFNRILVHAPEGKILNGSSSREGFGYRVFKLDNQPLKVRFKAPKKSTTGFYQILVYNSCDILPVDKTPLRNTKPDRQIAALQLNGLSSAWNGKLTYQLRHEFKCTHGNTVNETKNREQFVEMLLSIEKIDFGGSPTARIKNVKGSGNITIRYSFRREETRKEYYGLKTTNADNTFTVNETNLTGMIIQKKMSEDPAAMKKRYEELSKSDPGKLMEEIKSMYKGKNEDEFPVEIVLTVNGLFPIIAKSETIVKSKYKDTNDSRADESPFLFIPMQVKLSGRASFNDDGTGTINASYTAPEDLSNGMPSSFGCPPIKGFVDCKLTLSKTRAE